MNRVLELFNKTNQFNTTDARYTLEQCHRLLTSGRQLHIFHAEDHFTQYGLAGAAWVHQNCVEHFVMSCRILGLGIEETFLAHLAQEFVGENTTVMLGRFVSTPANTACRDLYSRNGFTRVEGNPELWSRSLITPFPMPSHVKLGVTNNQPAPDALIPKPFPETSCT